MADEEKEEKKEGKFKSFFKKVGNKLSDTAFEMRMQSDFDKSHKKYTVYSGTAALTPTPDIAVEEHLDENYLLTLDDDEEIAAGNLIEDSDTGEVRHIAAVEEAKLTVDFDGKTTEVDALKVVLGEPAKKVDVIRVGSDFYLK